jgi:GTPase
MIITAYLSHLGSSEEIQKQSAKIVSFIDLAGHEKYLKTTVSGMVGLAPDYAMLSIAATHGLQGMATEHLGIALALEVPLFVVITKVRIGKDVICCT